MKAKNFSADIASNFKWVNKNRPNKNHRFFQSYAPCFSRAVVPMWFFCAQTLLGSKGLFYKLEERKGSRNLNLSSRAWTYMCTLAPRVSTLAFISLHSSSHLRHQFSNMVIYNTHKPIFTELPKPEKKGVSIDRCDQDGKKMYFACSSSWVARYAPALRGHWRQL